MFIWLLFFLCFPCCFAVRRGAAAIERNRAKARDRQRTLRGSVAWKEFIRQRKKQGAFDSDTYHRNYQRELQCPRRLARIGVPGKIRKRSLCKVEGDALYGGNGHLIIRFAWDRWVADHV